MAAPGSSKPRDPLRDARGSYKKTKPPSGETDITRAKLTDEACPEAKAEGNVRATQKAMFHVEHVSGQLNFRAIIDLAHPRKGVIPKPRALIGGARDLAWSGTEPGATEDNVPLGTYF
jgi:hypothetical protein